MAMIRRLASAFDRMLHGSFGEKFVGIAALCLPVDILVRFRFVSGSGFWEALLLVTVRSLVDSLILAVLWHIISTTARRS